LASFKHFTAGGKADSWAIRQRSHRMYQNYPYRLAAPLAVCFASAKQA